ncbi:nucleoside-diphosphate kinase [Gracilinema caldarium]|uniref:Nucleoside diphosphate kinase n=1 Tax=Gracilinema caldarium (strain ATCC 51460 / DSM 7334 / H1) TaxID=744872 RepID=F8F0C4_GRAC1|nr:nucleoside-diphosphate kinase [Gracilinema caldarium]AEJ18988.1 nucleoside diphosphate kinase [Gracilinema caldarium DSM 7334]
MEQTLSYVLVTPYTIAKSRTGGVIARLLSRLDLELVGAQMIAPDEAFVKEYAGLIRNQKDPANPKAADLLADYVLNHLAPSGGRKHRSLLLLFRGTDAVRKLSDIVGALYPENMGIESITGETIRDTYADMIVDPNDPSKVTYLEPAVLTPRSQEAADQNLALFARFLEDQPNIIENVVYQDPSKIERTLVILKPDNWKYNSSRPGTIIDMFSRTGLRIIAIKVHRFSIAEALEFYGPVKDALKNKLSPVFGKKAKELLEAEFKISLSETTEKALTENFGVEYALDQFEQIVEFMSGQKPSKCPVEEMNQPGSVKCMILIYEGENAVNKIRDVLGPTDPLKAPMGTVRREFGSNVMVNTAHASDSPDNAKREMGIVKINHNNCAEVIKAYLAVK